MRGVYDPRHERTWRHRAPERGLLTLIVWLIVLRLVWLLTVNVMDLGDAGGSRIAIGAAVTVVVSVVLTRCGMRLFFRRWKRRHWLIGAARAYQGRQDDRR
ncbi:hypothetical protein ACFWQ6_12140 [Streptomyces coelicoflavus]|uniref:hypothetical protein n=1 Tax=Streptomyces coelicoflavus TaxID=285562 RepID=UPI0002475853|nr:hypothetical protein SMCF_3934 [Streptomyces coelicoflavus ZG0656]MZE44046.1 hypothetical protein [Streptomyces sp. SID5477]